MFDLQIQTMQLFRLNIFDQKDLTSTPDEVRHSRK